MIPSGVKHYAAQHRAKLAACAAQIADARRMGLRYEAEIEPRLAPTIAESSAALAYFLTLAQEHNATEEAERYLAELGGVPAVQFDPRVAGYFRP